MPPLLATPMAVAQDEGDTNERAEGRAIPSAESDCSLLKEWPAVGVSLSICPGKTSTPFAMPYGSVVLEQKDTCDARD